MDWLCYPTLSAILTCLAFHPSQVCSRSATRVRSASSTGRLLVDLTKRTPGGTSQGGSSASRDDAGDRLGNLHLALFQSLLESGSQKKGSSVSSLCAVNDPEDIHHMFPGRFMSEDDLVHILPGPKRWVSNVAERSFTPQRRVVTGEPQPNVQGQFEQHAAFDVKTGAADFMTVGFCGLCTTEIGYEVVDQVMDFSGRNHSVINFKNAYQFIPAGRCLNENSPCGGGGSRCWQITRAHWSLVWTPGTGVNLVAHEVPSHCECLNLGSPVPFRTSQQQSAQNSASETGNVAATQSGNPSSSQSGNVRPLQAGKPSEVTASSNKGEGGGELKVAGLSMDQHGAQRETLASQGPSPLPSPTSSPSPSPDPSFSTTVLHDTTPLRSSVLPFVSTAFTTSSSLPSTSQPEGGKLSIPPNQK
ncbi:uncharacterized protein [Littorina saxatilis]|uniref:uncharacterized protein isoform X2 n=1 Tax=Littorina saxatilis TaxID=31220 RepID=UPI0038B605A7